jgi:hypothetical protein
MILIILHEREAGRRSDVSERKAEQGRAHEMEEPFRKNQISHSAEKALPGRDCNKEIKDSRGRPGISQKRTG